MSTANCRLTGIGHEVNERPCRMTQIGSKLKNPEPLEFTWLKMQMSFDYGLIHPQTDVHVRGHLICQSVLVNGYRAGGQSKPPPTHTHSHTPATCNKLYLTCTFFSQTHSGRQRRDAGWSSSPQSISNFSHSYFGGTALPS